LPGITDFLIEDCETGFLAQTGDVIGFAAHIERLAKDRTHLARLSEAVGVAARKRFSSKTCARAYVDLFETVMSEPPPKWRVAPWAEFKTHPLFKQHPLTRIIPIKHRKALRSYLNRLRRSPGQAEPVSQTPRVYQIINSIDMKRGGAERMARNLHAHLQSSGVDSHLVCIEPFGDGEVPQGAVSLDITSPYDLRAFSRLAAFVRRIRPGDVVHAHLFPTSLYLSLLLRMGVLKAPVLFTEHSTSNNRRSSLLGRAVDKQVYGPFEQIIAISQGVRSELQMARPWLNDITVIPNGCRLFFETSITRAPKTGPLTILSVGRLSPAKNFEAALEAIALLMPCDLRYIIAGDGAELADLKNMAARLGITDVVEFAGYVPDIRDLLQQADCFLIPSLWEGFGLAAVEGMNATLPVIASDVPGLREVVGPDGQAAILIDPEQPNQIATAIRRLAASPDLRAELGQRGFDRSKTFNLETYAKAHLHLYSKVRHGYSKVRHGHAF